MRIFKNISVLLAVLLGICSVPRFSEGIELGSYIGEYCFDMVTTETIFYDLNVEITGLLRLSVFLAPSGVCAVNGSLAISGNPIIVPLVGTAVKDSESLCLSLTRSAGFYHLPSVEFYTRIRESDVTPIEFFGLAHRYMPDPAMVGAPPPADLKEIGHQPFSGTLTPRACP
jgi:hypothetical protein